MKKKLQPETEAFLRRGIAQWAETTLARSQPLPAQFLKDLANERLIPGPIGAEPPKGAEVHLRGLFIVGLTERERWTATLCMVSNGERERQLLLQEIEKVPHLEHLSGSTTFAAEKVWNDGSRVLAALSIETDGDGNVFFQCFANIAIAPIYALYFLKDAWQHYQKTN